MRKLLLLLAWLSLSVVSYTQTLVAYYPFNGNANDQSGNAINPTFIGSGVTLTTDRFGNANKAYNFDGLTNSYMRMPSDLLPTANRTVSLWFKALDVTSRPAFLGYGGNSSTPPGTSYFMGLNGGGCGCYYTGGHWPGVNTTSYNYSTPPVNNWTHFVVTISGGTIKIYVNGNLGISTPGAFTSNTIVASKDFSLGVGVSALGVAPYTDVNMGYFNGSLDEVRIYDNAMTDVQVLQLYQSESKGMVAYYPFNGNANDESGNGNNGVVSGASIATDRFEQTGKAYNFTFNGTSSDKIQVAGTSGLNFISGGLSISGWFRFNGTAGAGNNYPIFSKHNCGEQSGYILMLYNDKITFWMAGAGGYSYLSTPESYTDGQWHHVAAVYDGATRYIFIDGQQKISDAFAYTVPNGANWALGGYNGCNGGFNGKVDEIRVYSRGLTPAEILQQYKNESTGLVAYYPFNGNANDESGNGNNGTVNGATLTTDRYGNANKAYNFNGANNFISVADNPELFSDELTLSWWYKVPEYSGTRVVIGWVNGGNRYQQFFSNNSLAYFNGYYNNCCYFNPTYNLTIVNQWQHVTVTYKKTNTNQSVTRLYINGELKQTDNHAAAITYQPGSTFFIGKTHDGGYFNGELDDIRVYSRLLSPNEILQLADVPIMPDLIAYLPMNGNANDMSGNGHNGTVVNAPPATDKYDNANSAYQFNGNGTGTSITLANSTSLDFYENFNGRPFSLSAWVNLGTNTGEAKQIIGKYNCGTPNGYMLLVNNGQLGFWMSVSGTWFPLSTTETYNDGKWHHVVATYDVTYQRLYVDGVLKGSMLTAYNNPAYGAAVKIGEPNGCGGLGILNGKVDEVKIYGSALDANQVTALYKQSRGSSNALLFKGNSTNHVLLPGPIAAPPAFFLEAWVKRNAVQTWQWLFSGMETNSWEWGLNGSLMVFGKLNAGAVVLSSPIAIDDNKWHHLALTYDGGPGTVSFYVDGMAAGTGTISASGSVPGTYAIGNRPGGSTESFDGYIDEFRIGGSARDINAIRNWMCRKPTTDGFSELGFHFNFDEQTINAAYDVEGGSKSLLIDGPQYVTSGAPIGDFSVANYSNPNIHGTILSLSSGEQFEVFDPVWGLTGVNIYVVKDPPETQVGILGLGTNDHYFGVHINSGGNPVSYTARYNYTGNPFVSTSTEPTLQLFKRADNSATNWANSGATLNTTANTLTVTGQNTEYILGSSGFALPVTLLSFEAKKINATTTQLNWKTSQEINNKGFEIQRSFDGSYFVNIGFVHGAGNSDIMKEYSTTDIPGKTGRVYYRLKQVDFDEQSKLSQIVSVLFDRQGIIKVYPNPAQQQVTIEGVEQYMRVQLLDAAGKMVKEQLNNGQYLLNMSLDGLKSGMYLLRLINGKDNTTIKLMIGN